MGRMKPKTPANDDLIIKLLDEGRIKVEEDHEDPVIDEATGKVLGPRTVIFTKDNRYRKREAWNKRNIQPSPFFIDERGAHGYFSVRPNGSHGRQVWLSARRVVWYAFLEERRKTSSMICPRDEDPMNYNRWNLIDRDQNEQNYIIELSKARPEEEVCSQQEGSQGDDIPF